MVLETPPEADKFFDSLLKPTSQIVSSTGEMYDHQLIDEEEYIRLVYRFAGETVPKGTEKIKGIRKPINAPKATPANTSQGNVKVSAETGDVNVKESQ